MNKISSPRVTTTSMDWFSKWIQWYYGKLVQWYTIVADLIFLQPEFLNCFCLFSSPQVDPREWMLEMLFSGAYWSSLTAGQIVKLVKQ